MRGVPEVPNRPKNASQALTDRLQGHCGVVVEVHDVVKGGLSGCRVVGAGVFGLDLVSTPPAQVTAPRIATGDGDPELECRVSRTVALVT